MSDRFGSTGTYRKEFAGSLSEIGKVVADIVFRPVVALAMPDWSEKKRDYILAELDRWGYDREWSRGFLLGLRECKGDVLSPVVEIISGKGFGGRDIKDKTMTKRHLVDRAIENLNAAALDLGDDQEALRTRKELICRRLKEKIVD